MTVKDQEYHMTSHSLRLSFNSSAILLDIVSNI